MRFRIIGVPILFLSFTAACLGQTSQPPTAPNTTAKNLIANGGFEQGKDPGAYSTEDTRSHNISSWSISKGTVDYIGSYFKAHGGQRCIDLDGTPGPGTIQQTFDTTPESRYRVTFAMEANRQGGPAIKRIRLNAAGTSSVFSFDTNREKRWTIKRWEFTAKDTRTTLAFASLSQKGNLFGALIDDISVVALPPKGAAAPPTK